MISLSFPLYIPPRAGAPLSLPVFEHGGLQRVCLPSFPAQVPCAVSAGRGIRKTQASRVLAWQGVHQR